MKRTKSITLYFEAPTLAREELVRESETSGDWETQNHYATQQIYIIIMIRAQALAHHTRIAINRLNNEGIYDPRILREHKKVGGTWKLYTRSTARC